MLGSTSLCWLADVIRFPPYQIQPKISKINFVALGMRSHRCRDERLIKFLRDWLLESILRVRLSDLKPRAQQFDSSFPTNQLSKPWNSKHSYEHEAFA